MINGKISIAQLIGKYVHICIERINHKIDMIVVLYFI